MSADWTPELTVNHAQLDEEHLEIFRRLEIAARSLEGTRDAAERAVSTLADAIVENLASEERLMDETLYPDRSRHRAAHELFMADFASMRDELREKGPTPLVAVWLGVRLPEWLRFHIRVNDAPLAAHLARRRPSEPGVVRWRRTGTHHVS
ncbi:bacteriohemerythrin [Anaeromyxobacter terrae]|uniref:bacteriohemerythrin n=1 Tax=Anaeromyxobacter terrae TaxID=2925406 RepID=UPI001F58672A|nr:hemerythrin domain-containing protein [Anaeromyxobacter sp. SG22]